MVVNHLTKVVNHPKTEQGLLFMANMGLHKCCSTSTDMSGFCTNLNCLPSRYTQPDSLVIAMFTLAKG